MFEHIIVGYSGSIESVGRYFSLGSILNQRLKVSCKLDRKIITQISREVKNAAKDFDHLICPLGFHGLQFCRL